MLTTSTYPQRTVGPTELFFSTTDHKGVITSVNSVFERLSAYPREELIRSAHNILRHPDMPGGLFAVMWERLLSGQPAVAYVKNLAKDGFEYWTLATITPLGDGFLSVRTAPTDAALLETVDGIYRDVVTAERAAREAGTNRVTAAQQGAAILTSRLADKGYTSIDDFMSALLPREINGLQSVSVTPQALAAAPAQLRELLEANLQTERALRQLLGRLDDYVAVARELDSAHETSAMLDAAITTASQTSQTVSQASPVLGKAGKATVALSDDMVAAMQRLTLSLEISKDLALDLRMKLALSKLHSEMVTAFILELAQGGADDLALDQVEMLSNALRETIGEVDATLSATDAGLVGVAEDIETLNASFTDFHRMLATWRQLVVRFRLSAQLQGQLAPVDEQLNEGRNRMNLLNQLADFCRVLAEPVDTAPLHQAVDRLVALQQN